MFSFFVKIAFFAVEQLPEPPPPSRSTASNPRGECLGPHERVMRGRVGLCEAGVCAISPYLMGVNLVVTSIVVLGALLYRTTSISNWGNNNTLPPLSI